eukprot:2723302-Amphidinium_carterae.1
MKSAEHKHTSRSNSKVAARKDCTVNMTFGYLGGEDCRPCPCVKRTPSVSASCCQSYLLTTCLHALSNDTTLTHCIVFEKTPSPGNPTKSRQHFHSTLTLFS